MKLLTSESAVEVQVLLPPKVLANGVAIALATREEVGALTRSQDIEKRILEIPTLGFGLRILAADTRLQPRRPRPELAKTPSLLPPKSSHFPTSWLACIRPCRADFQFGHFFAER